MMNAYPMILKLPHIKIFIKQVFERELPAVIISIDNNNNNNNSSTSISVTLPY